MGASSTVSLVQACCTAQVRLKAPPCILHPGGGSSIRVLLPHFTFPCSTIQGWSTHAGEDTEVGQELSKWPASSVTEL